MALEKIVLGIACAAAAAGAWWMSRASAPVPEPVAEESFAPTPTPRSTPTATATGSQPAPPVENGQACDRRLRALREGLAASSIDDDRANALTTVARATSSSDATSDRTCARRAYDVLAADASCARAKTAIAAGLFVGDYFEADWTADLVDRASPACLRAILPEVQSTTNVSARLEQSVERIAKRHADAELRDAAWLTLGSIELAAKNRGEAEVARLADEALASRLAAAPHDERTALLEAAGNGACDGCKEDVARARDDASPRVRAAAIGASRFSPEEDAVASMCDGLRKDGADDVREQAAWAMGWRVEHDEERVDCLASSAAVDGAPRVRKTAARSLTMLAPRSARAHAAVETLAKESSDEDVRAIAKDFLRSGDAPPDLSEVGL